MQMSYPCSRAQLLKVWALYKAHRRPYVGDNTYTQDYAAITKRLRSSPQWIESTDGVIDWLTNAYSRETARRMLQQIKAAFRWAARANQIRRDPFANIPNFPNPAQPDQKYRAFTGPERKAILKEFDSSPPAHRLWVWGIFLTGCRPEELRALTIGDYSASGKQLSITKAYRDGVSAPHPTKNGRITPDFPVNEQLAQILKESSGDRPASDWLFRNANGGAFSYRNFQTKHWKPKILALVERGAIAWYLPQKHARHTWITMMLEAGTDITTIAYLARNTPAIIYRNYAQRERSPKIPPI